VRVFRFEHMRKTFLITQQKKKGWVHRIRWTEYGRRTV